MVVWYYKSEIQLPQNPTESIFPLNHSSMCPKSCSVFSSLPLRVWGWEKSERDGMITHLGCGVTRFPKVLGVCVCVVCVCVCVCVWCVCCVCGVLCVCVCVCVVCVCVCVCVYASEALGRLTSMERLELGWILIVSVCVCFGLTWEVWHQFQIKY